MPRLRGELVGRERVGGYWRVRLRLPEAGGWAPGQFAMLQPQGSSFFLPRAFSLHDQKDQDVSFLVAPIGPASEDLCQRRVGETVWVLGPLGHGFPLREVTFGGGRVVIVTGGVGIAPFPPVLNWLRESWLGLVDQANVPTDPQADPGMDKRPEILCLFGFKDVEQAGAAKVLEQGMVALQAAGWRTRSEVISELGDGPRRGVVTDLVAELLRPGDRVLVCGPEAMSAAVWDECGRVPNVLTWFSLEARMACGVGSCHGCVIPAADGTLVMVCRRGPVFRGADVFGAERTHDE